MPSDAPIAVAVVAESDPVYTAIASMLGAGRVLRIDEALVEQGEVEREGRKFLVYLVGNERANDLQAAMGKLPGAPRVLVHIHTSYVLLPPAAYSLAIRATREDADRWLGELFADRLRIAARHGVAVPTGVNRERTPQRLGSITTEPSEFASAATLVWHGTWYSSGGEFGCARGALELTLATLANAPPPRPQAHDAAPSPRVTPPPVSGYLDRVVLAHVKCLDAVTWELGGGPGFHVVLGQNASGKTGLLRAITTALLSHDEVGALRVDWAHWVRQGHAAADCELHFAGGAASGWRFADGALEKTGHAWAGFSAAYGPFRRFTGGDLEYVREFESQRRLLRHLSLFSERVALSDALKWLQDLEFRQSKKMPGAEVRDVVVAFVNETGLLPDGVALSRIDPDGVWFRDANGAELPADELSDGYRAILSLALDLLRHLAADHGAGPLFERSDGGLTVAAAGLVLIDEIDAHLHATWQQRIGRWFKARFPRFLFLVATHSAIVCQSADGVLLLPDPGSGAAPRALTGNELARIRYGDLLDAFDTGAFGEGVTRSEESRRKLERLAELNTAELHRDLTEAERDELRALRHVLPSTAFTTQGDAP